MAQDTAGNTLDDTVPRAPDVPTPRTPTLDLPRVTPQADAAAPVG